MVLLAVGIIFGILVGMIADVVAYNIKRRKLRKKTQTTIQEILEDEDGPCRQCITTCIACSAAECFKKELASLKCVQAGWAFGVPEDGRDQWLDIVVKLMRKYA